MRARRTRKGRTGENFSPGIFFPGLFPYISGIIKNNQPMKKTIHFVSNNRQFTLMVAMVMIFIAVVIFNAVSYGCVNPIASH